jgi:hypothetical protein
VSKLAILSLNRLEAALYNIIRLNRDIRVIGGIRERMPSRKTPIDSYSKLKARIIKN